MLGFTTKADTLRMLSDVITTAKILPQVCLTAGEAGKAPERVPRLLDEAGLTVVCCTISMFDDVRAWNRENIPGYFEVYIKASMETLRHRDKKRQQSR